MYKEETRSMSFIHSNIVRYRYNERKKSYHRITSATPSVLLFRNKLL